MYVFPFTSQKTEGACAITKGITSIDGKKMTAVTKYHTVAIYHSRRWKGLSSPRVRNLNPQGKYELWNIIKAKNASDEGFLFVI